MKILKEFYDYKTLPVDGNQVIDPHKTGMSFYDDFLDPTETAYLRDSKNLKGNIVQMSPDEYYKLCSEYGFSHKVSVDSLKQSRSAYKQGLDELKDVLLKHKKRFPMPMINLADNTQEGLHRMMVIGDLYGWNHKVPVLVVDWYDRERAERAAREREKSEIDWNVERAITTALYYTYHSIEELEEQLMSELRQKFQSNDKIQLPIKINLNKTKGGYAFTFAGYEYVIDDTDIKLELPADDADEFDDEDIEDFLVRYFGDNWRETHPHLKDTFHIKEDLTTKTVRREH